MASAADDRRGKGGGAWRLRYAGDALAPPDELAPRLAVANGRVGVVGASPLDAPPRTWLAGFFAAADVADEPVSPEALRPLPRTGRLSITIDRVPIPKDGRVAGVVHELDMWRARLETRWQGGGALEGISAARLASLADRALQLSVVRLDFRAGADVEIALRILEDQTQRPDSSLAEGVELWRADRGSATRALLAWLEAPNLAELLAPGERRRWRARAGESLTVAQAVAVARGEAGSDVCADAARAGLSRARASGWRNLTADHEAAWAERWRLCHVEVDGDDDAQRALRFAAYHLISAADPGDESVSVGARGLTGPTYQGHVFWDTEIYLLPFHVLTRPDVARTMLMYRHRTLDAARAKAERLGYRGAYYAWESAQTGEEAAPRSATTSRGQQVQIVSGWDETHISADVAYAVWRYWRASEDDDFFREAGAEIVLETARFWASKARREADGRWHIRHVEGPDEYHQAVDDNAFTNAMASWNLERGAETWRTLRERWPVRWEELRSQLRLSEAEAEGWDEIAPGIVTGFEPKQRLYEQFAGYFGLEPIDPRAYADLRAPIDVVLGQARIQQSQAIKQADVVEMLALLPARVPPDAAGANFDYYEARCAHGSSLSLATHALVAARLGRADQALAFFHRAARTDLGPPSDLSAGGVHMATLGGLWQTAVFGFAGVVSDGDDLMLEPRLPTRWRGLSFRLQWRGRLVGVDLAPDGAWLTLETGDPIWAVVAGDRKRLSRDMPQRWPALVRSQA